MTLPNNPGPQQRRALGDAVSRKGWFFGGIILVGVVLVVLAFTWAGNDSSVPSTANPPAATTGASSGAPNAAGTPATPARR